MELLLILIILAVMGIGGFYAACHIIKLWTGCNDDEAATKLHNWINGKAQRTFSNDIDFYNQVWLNVKNVIGEVRYKKLEKLSCTAVDVPMLAFDDLGDLPRIEISVEYADEHEKLILENVLSRVVIRKLKIYGYDQRVIVKWTRRGDLDMPVLQIEYAKTSEERRILTLLLQDICQDGGVGEKPVTDDTEVEDLND